MKRMVANYLLFQAGWFACVVGAGQDMPWLGPIVVAIAVMVHLVMAVIPRKELALLAICALTGLLFDSLLLLSGWVSYPNGMWLAGLAPYWMIALWVLFGTTLNLSMGWMRDRAWVAFLVGALGGPLSYLAGQKLGAMEIHNTSAAILALAVGWGVLMPVLAQLASRFNGFEAGPRPPFVHDSWRDKEVNHA